MSFESRHKSKLRLHNVNTGFNTSLQASAGIGSIAQKQSDFQNETSRTVEDNKYGLSDQEYRAYVKDCQESVEMCSDVHHFYSNNADVFNYFL